MVAPSALAGAVGGPKDWQVSVPRGKMAFWVIKFEGGKRASVTIDSNCDSFDLEIRGEDNILLPDDAYLGDNYYANANWTPQKTMEYAVAITNTQKQDHAYKCKVETFRLKTN